MNLKKVQNWHWIVWISSVFYALWKFKLSSEKNFFYLNNSDFEDGWLVINRPKDRSDFEWTVLKHAFKRFWPLMVFQLFVSEILLRVSKNVLPFFYAIYSIISLTIIIGEKAAFVSVVFIIIAFILHKYGKKSFGYALCLCTLLLKNNSYVLNMTMFTLEDEKQSFLFDVAFMWITAKCLSFMIDRINWNMHNNISLHDLFFVVGYCLYLPTVFTGPLLAYDSFVDQVKRRSLLSFKAFTQRFVHLFYIMFWYLIYEAMLHLIYSSSILYYPDIVRSFNSWSLCGLGYALPLMFYLKYFIIYSMAQSIAGFENFELPPPPKCISCIHLSTHLWRTFDKGLYLWISKYLYHPLMQGRRSSIRKMGALAVSFFFVCLWHNIDKAICVWTFLNFVLVASETIMQMLYSSARRKKYVPKFLNQKWVQAALDTPHFIMMCISCTFFLANWDIGVILFNRIMFSGVLPLLPVCFIMYCGCEVSLDVQERENRFQHHYGNFWIWRKSN